MSGMTEFPFLTKVIVKVAYFSVPVVTDSKNMRFSTFSTSQSWAIVSTINHYQTTFLQSLSLSLIYKMVIVIVEKIDLF